MTEAEQIAALRAEVDKWVGLCRIVMMSAKATALRERSAIVTLLGRLADTGLGDEGPGALYDAIERIKRAEHHSPEREDTR